MAGRIYSVGYEDLTLGAFVDRLVGSKVTTLFDVRLNASSRRPGFSKKALSGALEAAGISYVHERDLGNPQANRDSFRAGDGTQGREVMHELLVGPGDAAVRRLVERARLERVAVMCVERDRSRCHRDVVTDRVAELEPSIEIIQIL
jgi:uncharacterized protein (DUF488 family)